MKIGTLLLIDRWPAWQPGHGHPAIVWEFDDASGLYVVLPISHSDKHLVQGIQLTKAEFGAAYLASGPLVPDEATSFIHIRELMYENDFDERTVPVDSGLGAKFDESSKLVHFPNYDNSVSKYSKELWMNPTQFQTLKLRENPLIDPTIRLT